MKVVPHAVVSLLLIAAISLKLTGSQSCTGSPQLDVALLVDESGSVCDTDSTFDGQICDNWRDVRQFLLNVVNSFTIGPNDVQFSLVVFGNLARVVFPLTSLRTTIVDGIQNVNYQGQNTNTSAGLKLIRDQVFVGPRARSNAQKVIILLTDGPSTFNRAETIPVANEIKGQGVLIYAVGVFMASQTELQAVVSPAEAGSSEQNYLLYSQFSDLRSQAAASITQRVCPSGGGTTSTPTTTTAPPMPTQIPTTRSPGRTTSPRTPDCGIAIMDLTFLVDSSGSVCDNDPSFNRPLGICDNWELVRQFMVDIVEEIGVGERTSRVALINFSNQARILWNLNAYINNQSGLVDAIRNLKYEGGTTNTAGAFNLMLEEIYNGDTAATGDRRNIQDVVIVITDGKSNVNNSLTVPTAEIAHSREIRVFSIGVTDQVDENELQRISSRDQVRGVNWFTTPDFTMLDIVLDSVLAGACDTPPPPAACRDRADVIVILDASGSIREHNFQRLKEWLSAVVLTLDIDSGRVQLGLMTFSDTAQVQFFPNEFLDRESIINAIAAVGFTRGTTNTASALQQTTFILTSDQFGIRPGVNKIALLITDGGSNNKVETVAAATSLKRAGIQLLAVGVGDWTDRYELFSVASHPYIDNVIEVPDYDNLNFVSNRITNLVCNNNNPCLSFPCENGGSCEVSGDSYVCQCVFPFSGQNCQYLCRRPADVSLALDSSGSINRDNFLLMVDFARALMTELPLEGAVFSLQTFADNPNVYLNFNDYTSRRQFLNSLTIPYISGGTTDTAGALRTMRDVMFTVQNGDNPNRPNVGVVVTDGRSNNPADTYEQAARNRDTGIDMIAVGVGRNARQDELTAIASWPTSQNVINVPDFGDLLSFVPVIRDLVCNAVDDCSPNPCQNGGVCRDLSTGYVCECPSGFSGTNCQRSCDGLLDLAIVIDKSGSISPQRFPQVLGFVVEVLQLLSVYGDSIRVAAVSFHDNTQLHFTLNTFNNRQQDAITAIRRIAFGGGRTDIATALDVVRNNVFIPAGGDRLNAPNLVLLFTDGASNIRRDVTLKSAIATRIRGARIMTVAVGTNLDMLELFGIASQPTTNNVFTVQRYNELPGIIEGVVAGTCNDVNECTSNPCQNGGQCVDGFRSYSCQCVGDFTGENCQNRCPRSLDAVFILDLSGSVESVYEQMMTFVRTALNGVDMKRDRARVALVTYADDAEIQFSLNTYSDKRDALNALSLQRAGGRTNTHSALNAVSSNVFTTATGDRMGVPNVVVLLTDGGTNTRIQDTGPAADRIKSSGAELYVVAVGDNIDMAEIQRLASPGSSYILSVSSTSDAVSQAVRWLDSVCL